MNVTFTINNVDFSTKLSTYSVSYEYEYPNVVQTIDGTEHYGKVNKRPSITFSFWPLTDTESAALYSALSGTNTVTYTDPNAGATRTATMRFTGNVSARFGLKSGTGDNYYRGGEMVLRQLSVL